MTFESEPIIYSSVNEPLVYVVYDANSIDPTKTDYKYIGECWVGGVKVFTARNYPNPENNRGVFDFATVVREYITPSLKEELGVNEFWVEVQIKIKEEYNGSVGAVVATSTATPYFNHYNGRINDFTKLFDYADLPITNRPTETIYIKSGTTVFYLPVWAKSGSGFDVVIDGVLTSYSPTANSIMNINIANSLTSDYVVAFSGGINATFNVKVLCEGLYTNYNIHFLNKWGGFETMLFNKVSKRSYEIEKKSYQQLPYRVSSAGVVSLSSNNIMNEQKTTYASKFKEKLRVSTDFLNDEEYVWLAQLLCSPMVYLEDTDGTLYPVSISNSNYEFKEHLVDRLTNLTIDLDFNTSYKTQFR
jgi:hypothetical protein